MTDHRISRRSRLPNPTAALREIDVPIEMPLRHYPLGTEPLPGEKLELYKLFARSLDEDATVLIPFEARLAKDRDVPVEAALQLAQVQLQRRRYDEAAKTLAAIDSQFHTLPLFQLHWAVAQLGREQFAMAVKQLTKTTADFPDFPPAWYNRGIAHSRIGQNDAASEFLQNAVALRPDYVKARNRLGSLFAMGDRLAEAAKQFKSASTIAVKDLESYRKLSAVLRRQQQWQAAIDQIEDALQISKNDRSLLQELALLLLDVENGNNRNPKFALDVARQLMAIKDDSNAIILTALALLENQRPEEALALASKQWDSDERKAEAGLLIAISQQMLGSAESARRNFSGAESALVQMPQDRIARTILGFAREYFATVDPIDTKNRH